MTTWSDYVVGMFKIRHPHVYTLADVGQMLFGPIGRELFGFGYWVRPGQRSLITRMS